MPGIDECLLEAMTVNGARGAAVIEWTSGLALGMVGEVRDEDPEATAAETAELARMAAEQRAFAALGPGRTKSDAESGADGDDTGGEPAVEDIIVTTRTCYHLLRFVDTAFDNGVFFYLWLDRREGNLALARMRLRDMCGRLALI
ncbi:hypothetical protein ACFV27_15890 [Streptomyces antimycoticus]|uniref:Roadblock/LAMTOR2 domain-containing protein n=3 Tax=Streptomyces violaceusniger group TaxID=2839105 RepID=A0ABD5J794_9ACTN|nr:MULTISPECIES: hypothetical protein [Streptomyces]MEE4584240.1 hypothetical protein [Streptomyces sp. DSM 41602]AJZ84368.1 hypothetical protein AS97_21125 [Streptomyces sp. AgN23]KUL45310.1 hypothetical protein ADL28_37970 [Streptomyces violaceusniger]RSS39705.1 hypothetical protein EF902_26920 [Streptomyces sp. WAC05858]WJE01580.1 hypothetical protein QR300_39745 [Streptomyces antimycoticus]